MQSIKEYVEIKKAQIKEEVDSLTIKPKLVIVQVGNVEASNRYVKNKMKDCAECNIPCELIHLDESITEADLLSTVIELNNNPTVTGFIVQLPLPKHIRESIVIEAIDPKKDVDGFSKLALVNPGTPQGIIDFLDSNNFEYTNKNAVVIGRSNIVGKPMAKLLLEKNCNVTILHSKTSNENKRLFLKNADLVVTAVGKRGLIDETYVLKPTVWIIDCGINLDENGKLIGDCERNLSFFPVAFQSPVPGGVGLTTRLALITNLIKLYKLQN